MRLSELAEQLGKDPADLLEILMKSPIPFFTTSSLGGGIGDIYGVKIVSHLVEAAKDYILKETAQEVIDHVKEHGTSEFERQASLEDEDQEDND